MATARTSNDLIDAALRLLGVLGTTETAPAADTTLGLEALQDLLAEWSGDGLMVPSVTVSTFGLVNGQVAYRVGEGSMTLGTTLSGAAETQVDVGAGNIPTYAPSTGTLRVILDTAAERIVDYTSHDSSRYFTIGASDWQNPLDATAGNLVYLTALTTTRPERVLSVFIRDTGTAADTPVRIVGEGQYQIMQTKDTGSGKAMPSDVWINYAAPLVTFTFWPEPDSSDDDVYFSSFKPFTEPTVLTTNLLTGYSIPRNYYNAIKFCLAEDLAPYYGRELPLDLVRRAQQAKLNVQVQNARLRREPTELDKLLQNMKAVTQTGA